MTKLRKPPQYEAIETLNPVAFKEVVRDLTDRDKVLLVQRLGEVILDTHYSEQDGLTHDQETNVILILEELVRNDVSLNALADTKYPLMHSAVMYPGIVRELMRHGYDINTVDDLGWTALAAASFNSHPGTTERVTIQILLAAGADPNIQVGECFTALMAAAESAKEIDATEIINQLVAHGADLNLRDTGYYSALDYAIMNRSRVNTECLLNHGAELTKRFEFPDQFERVTASLVRQIKSIGVSDEDRIFWRNLLHRMESTLGTEP